MSAPRYHRFQSTCFPWIVLIALGVLWLGTLSIRAADYYVRPSETCTNSDLQSPYTNWDIAATNIQWAVNVAMTNVPATVWVTNGIYVLTSQVNIAGGVILQSVNGASNTIIDGNGLVRCCIISNGTVDGFTMTNGSTDGSGGGVDVKSSCNLYNSIITKCRSSAYGGGFRSGSGSSVTNCIIRGNTANITGGGYSEIGTIIGCTVVGNTSTNPSDGGGGGLFMNRGMISNCTILCNTSYAYAGGVYLMAETGNTQPATMDNCNIVSNKALKYGGGVYMQNDNYLVSMVNCNIEGNDTDEGGGGVIMIYGGLVRNCLVISNKSGWTTSGIYIFQHSAGTGIVESCTVVNSKDRGLYCNGTGYTNNMIKNSIFYYNPVNVLTLNPEIPLTNCCTTPAALGTGNITNEPLFINTNSGNYRLLSSSPCINRGMNQNWMTNSVDLDGKTRIRYGTVDMGVYERINEGTIYNFP